MLHRGPFQFDIDRVVSEAVSGEGVWLEVNFKSREARSERGNIRAAKAKGAKFIGVDGRPSSVPSGQSEVWNSDGETRGNRAFRRDEYAAVERVPQTPAPRRGRPREPVVACNSPRGRMRLAHPCSHGSGLLSSCAETDKAGSAQAHCSCAETTASPRGYASWHLFRGIQVAERFAGGSVPRQCSTGGLAVSRVRRRLALRRRRTRRVRESAGADDGGKSGRDGRGRVRKVR